MTPPRGDFTPDKGHYERVPYYADDTVTLLHGDAAEVLAELPTGSVDCIVTSPPYWGLRDYGVDGQIGHEVTPAEYVDALRAVFAELARALVPTGTCWLNLGDKFSERSGGRWSGQGTGRGPQAGMLPQTRGPLEKSLLGLPWRVAFALQDDGWTIRNAIVWHKPNAMPESVTDRLSSRHEELFLLTRSTRYHFDLDAIREPHTMRPQRRPNGHKQRQRLGVLPAQTWSTSVRDEPGVDGHPLGRNPGDVWTIPTTPSRRDHYAAFPVEIPRRCIAAGSPDGGTVLDPFSGTGTTGEAARQLGRRYIGVDLNASYLDIQVDRFAQSVIA